MNTFAHLATRFTILAAGVFVLSLNQGLAAGQSFYTTRLEDPEAVYLTPDKFPVAADGVQDDAAALQMAIDQVGEGNRAGVLFVPEGTYRLGKTVYVWPGVRLIGCGSQRPVFLLGENTPGFQDGVGKYMLYFSGGRGREENPSPRDGNPGTFYSALSNIDIEIHEGNPAAVGIRFHVAQHCFLSHMEFRLGSAKAGLEDIGNVVESLRFVGGQYGIVTGRSAPGWPILVMDCTFEGQKVSCIKSGEGGLTIVQPQFRDSPSAVSIDADRADELWVSDAVIENITDAAFLISRENSARTQINLENLYCTNVSTLAQFRESGKLAESPGPRYIVDKFTHGLHLGETGEMREIKTTVAIRPTTNAPPAISSDIPNVPPVDSWVNVQQLGILGDGTNDVTGALQETIDSYRTLYFPQGVYCITSTLKLRSDTILVGLNPSTTALFLPNETPAFQDAHSPESMIEAPAGGSNIISGIGIYPGPLNPGAFAVKWMAGERSMVNDVRFHGGHGTRIPGNIGDNWGRDHRDHWDGRPPSLWVTADGGGIFKNIWTPSPYANAGMIVSDTHTPGRVYAMSLEHHVSNEMIMRGVSNWCFYAVQFEEEREESPKALPLAIDDCSNLLFANTFFYRVVSSFVPQPCAISITDSLNIRFRNVHVYSNSKVSFDNSICIPNTGQEFRDPEFAWLTLDNEPYSSGHSTKAATLNAGFKLEKLADGFLNITGMAVDNDGNLYFTDPRELQVYRWSAAEHRAEPVIEVTQRPEQLAFDRAGNLLIVAYEGNGTVLSWNPDSPDSPPQIIKAQTAKARPGIIPILPVNRWMGAGQFASDSTTRKPYQFLSPDGTVFIPAGSEFIEGTVSWGVKLSDLLRAFRLAPAPIGKRFYVSNEAELQTWSFKVDADGTLTDPKLFVEEGGECVALDSRDRVYIAAGQVKVYEPSGKLLRIIEIPQRPTCLAFGGVEKETLFVGTRSALYGANIEHTHENN